MPRASSKMPAGLRAYWRKKNGQSRRRRAASRSTRPKRVYNTKRSFMPRKKSKGGRRGRKTVHVLDVVAKLNALFQGLEPFIQRGIIAAVAAGDFAAVITILREGGKEAASLANLVQALGPIVGLKVVKFVMSSVGAPNPRFGRVALI